MEIDFEEWVRVRNCVDQLDHTVNGNGKPALEMRLREYIDQRDAHKENNARQDVADLEKKQDDRHKENSHKFDQLFRLGYIGMGIMIALESAGLFKR